MIKTNVVLNAFGVLLLGVLAFMGRNMWDDISQIKAATSQGAVKIENISRTVDDHEVRLRQNERDITKLQSERRGNEFRTPKQLDN